MVAITVVEPNTLLRLGLLKLLKTLDCRAIGQGIDYTQLFDGAKPPMPSADLLLLSVPTSYIHAKELIITAQQRLTPRRILLLSDTQAPPYSLLNLPSALAGYVCKFASQDILKTSIMLVLSGGMCFPRPDTAHADTPPSDSDTTPRRRWYDHNNTPRTLTPDLIKQEIELLHLTPRQYGILSLMAKGYPLKQISRELAISVATVKTHTEALYQRLDVKSRNAAVYAAISRGATLGCWDAPPDPTRSDPP